MVSGFLLLLPVEPQSSLQQWESSCGGGWTSHMASLKQILARSCVRLGLTLLILDLLLLLQLLLQVVLGAPHHLLLSLQLWSGALLRVVAGEGEDPAS